MYRLAPPQSWFDEGKRAANLIDIYAHFHLAHESPLTLRRRNRPKKQHTRLKCDLAIDSDELSGEDTAALKGISGRELKYLSTKLRSLSILSADGANWLRAAPQQEYGGPHPNPRLRNEQFRLPIFRGQSRN